jgi:ubiquinol-cytochrome c reductase cytochrome b subunit
MPAYGKNLSPPEVAALVAFMSTLHKPTEAPARDSSRPARAASEVKHPNTTAEMANAKR